MTQFVLYVGTVFSSGLQFATLEEAMCEGRVLGERNNKLVFLKRRLPVHPIERSAYTEVTIRVYDPFFGEWKASNDYYRWQESGVSRSARVHPQPSVCQTELSILRAGLSQSQLVYELRAAYLRHSGVSVQVRTLSDRVLVMLRVPQHLVSSVRLEERKLRHPSVCITTSMRVH